LNSVQVLGYRGDMPRDTLTREQIVRAAVELLDADGAEGLSMRRLGDRLGSVATAVYWHVKSKDDLVVLAADTVWGEVELPDPGEVGWRTAATRIAHDTYTMITRHPWLLPAMTTQLVYGPGKARYDDHCLAVYEAAGFTGADADNAHKTVFAFVLATALGEAAELLWRARVRHDGGDEEQQLRDTIARASEIAMRFPRLRARVQALEDADPAVAGEQSFEFGLQAILDGLQGRLPTRLVPADPGAPPPAGAG
jgi:AcrR family transcriptional regulator